MTYLQDRKNKKNKFFVVLLVLFFLFIIIYFNNPIFNFLSKNLGGIFNPVLTFSNNLKQGVSDFGVFFKSKKVLFSENQNLKDSLERAEMDLLEKDILLNENTELKETLNRKKAEDNFVLARIIGKRINSLYDTLLVDLGEDDGVFLGDVVFAYGNIPIGKIVEVNNKSSKVLLYSAPKEKNQVFLNEPTLLLEMVGRGGGNFEIVLPRDVVVEEGTKAFLPELSSYVVAEVRKIISDPRDSFQKILLTSPVNTEHLRFVEIKR